MPLVVGGIDVTTGAVDVPGGDIHLTEGVEGGTRVPTTGVEFVDERPE